MVRWAPVVQFYARICRRRQNRATSQAGVAIILKLFPCVHGLIPTLNGFGVRSCVWQKQSATPPAWPPSPGA